MTESCLICCQSGASFPYRVHRGLVPAHVCQLNAEWEEEKIKVIQQMFQDVPAAQTDAKIFRKQVSVYRLDDMHWRWLDKALKCNTDEHQWFFLTADEKIQSVCVIFYPKPSRTDGARIFYIDYVASAYWNRTRPGYTKKFGNVGRILISEAANYAVTGLGYRPGFCLHSLPTAESYYRKLGMIEFEADPEKENLRYYEAPPEVVESLAEDVSNG